MFAAAAWIRQHGSLGMRTTEFWLTVAIELVATIGFASGGLNGSQWVDISKVVIGAYAVSRGISKHGRSEERNGEDGDGGGAGPVEREAAH